MTQRTAKGKTKEEKALPQNTDHTFHKTKVLKTRQEPNCKKSTSKRLVSHFEWKKVGNSFPSELLVAAKCTSDRNSGNDSTVSNWPKSPVPGDNLRKPS